MRINYLYLIFIPFLIGCQQKQITQGYQARLYFIIGDVTVNKETAKIGQILHSNDAIETDAESRAEILFGAGSGIQIRENSQAVILIDKGNVELHLEKGAALNLAERGKNYLVRGSTAVAAVRGTIFYVHSYDANTQYTCTCNGSIELQFGQESKSVSASHHKPYTISQSTSVPTLLEDVMKEHNDEEIFDFMYSLDKALRSE